MESSGQMGAPAPSAQRQAESATRKKPQPQAGSQTAPQVQQQGGDDSAPRFTDWASI